MARNSRGSHRGGQLCWLPHRLDESAAGYSLAICTTIAELLRREGLAQPGPAPHVDMGPSPTGNQPSGAHTTGATPVRPLCGSKREFCSRCIVPGGDQERTPGKARRQPESPAPRLPPFLTSSTSGSLTSI